MKVSASPRPTSRGPGICRQCWIPAFAGMTDVKPKMTVALLLLLALPTFAQVRASHQAILKTLSPGSQVASGQDVWAIFNNPAGLAFVSGSELVGGYVYNWLNPNNFNQAQLAAGFSLFEGFTLGLGMNLGIPPNGNQGYITGDFVAAYRFGRTLSLGVWSEKQRQYSLDQSDPFLFGFGFQYYPTSWLALGAYTKQADGDWTAPLEFQVGAAVRPFGDRLTVFAESKFFPNSTLWSKGYQINPATGFRLDLEGVSLVAHAVIQENPAFMFSVDLHFDHFGMGAVGGNSFAGGRFRISSEGHRGLISDSNSWVHIHIGPNGSIQQAPTNSLLEQFFHRPIPSVAFIKSLDELVDDRSISGVFIQMEALGVGFARAEELRNSLNTLKNSGKQVIMYLKESSAVDYYVASAATRIYLHPAAVIDLDIFHRTLIHVRKALDNLGVESDAIVAGRYKTAPRLFTANSWTEQELEVSQNILDQRYNRFIEAVTERVKKPTDEIKSWINLGIITSDEALSRGLVDQLASLEGLPELKQKFSSKFMAKKKFIKWSEPDQIAVIPIVGDIIRGRAINNLLFPKAVTGAADVVNSINQAAQNRHVKAIILRVDSPGGDSIGGEELFEAAMNARKHKPILTSIADIGASAAYQAAAGTQQIWVEPSTLTGSIGCFFLAFSAQKLFNKLGIETQEIKKGNLPGWNLFRPLTEPEKKRGQELIDWRYERFKKDVSLGQGLELSVVDTLAEGRVWTGSEALSHRLVTQIGGFGQVWNEAIKMAQLPEDSKPELVIYQNSGAFSMNINPLSSLDAFMESQGKPLSRMPFIL